MRYHHHHRVSRSRIWTSLHRSCGPRVRHDHGPPIR
jgi:hypothetical protein